MDWIVPVSPQERAQGTLAPATAQAALATLAEQGCVLLRGAYDPALVDEIHREFTNRYGALAPQQLNSLAFQPAPNPIVEVGEGRYDIAMAMTGLFAQPRVFANPLVTRLAYGLLGDDMRLSGFTTVVSYPGAKLQHPHRDHRYLFHDHDASRAAPVYAINVAVPLIDVDAQTGPTAVWLGSHQWREDRYPAIEESASVPYQRGDCILLDYRTMHTGLPNGGSTVRPILYMVYARTWFFDEVNHIGRVSLDMTLDQFARLPPELQPLLSRAFSAGVRARWRSV